MQIFGVSFLVFFVFVFFGFLLAAVSFFVLTFIKGLQVLPKSELFDLHKTLSSLQATNEQLQNNYNEVKNDQDNKNRELNNYRIKTSSLETEKELLKQQLDQLKTYVEEIKKQSKIEFENLANKVLEAKSKNFSEITEKSLDTLLTPLKEKISSFEKVIDEKYSNESKERFALKSEIIRLIGLNDKMTKETNSLTQALRGDSKIQGDWGEFVLERILEDSGLRKDHEYSIQESLKDDDGDRFRPDVVINLPEEKHVIVDSKVSLKSYDLYRTSIQCTQDDEILKHQEKYLNDHLRSIDKHVEELVSKHYAKLKGVNSPELVFMFIPIEPAYLLAMQSDPTLAIRAWQKGVAIVTATTLLTSLKTVASIWRLEKQNKNALEIAQEGARLYDKFVNFLEDFEKIGATFESGHKHYSNALAKLKNGPGNVFRKMETLRELGASPNKRIKQDYLD